jgi:hypothetical protein
MRRCARDRDTNRHHSNNEIFDTIRWHHCRGRLVLALPPPIAAVAPGTISGFQEPLHEIQATQYDDRGAVRRRQRAPQSPAAPKLGIVYDAGGKFDKSFNQSAAEGAERFKKETASTSSKPRPAAIPRPSRCCAASPARSST